MGWVPGEVIVHQEIWAGRVWAARPLVVVEDRPDQLLLWIPHGTVRKVPMTPPGRTDPGERTARIIELLEVCDWIHVDHVWDVSSLWILRPGAWHATWVGWMPTGEHLGWYVNLQRPVRRASLGIEAMDLMLDVVVDPDGAWRWKDEVEFEEILRRGIFDGETGQRVRDEAHRVIRQIEASDGPFGDRWIDWMPDPSWGLPVLRPGWDDPS